MEIKEMVITPAIFATMIQVLLLQKKLHQPNRFYSLAINPEEVLA